MLTVPNYFKSQVLIDGELLRIHVARMTVNQASVFRRAFDKFSNSEAVRLVSTRKDGEEMEKRAVPRDRTPAEIAAAEALARFDETRVPVGAGVVEPVTAEANAVIEACRALVPAEPVTEAFVIPLEEIRRRRITEMTPAERQAYDDLDAEEDAFADKFLADSIAAYVTVPEGELQETDVETGAVTSITSGADLVRIFARIDQAILVGIVNAIRIENSFPESRKKAWRSLFDSFASSKAPATDPAGSEPEPTADAAAPKASVQAEDAMASSAIGSAGR